MAEHPWDFDWDDWVEPAYPMTGPAFDWSTIRYITIHYPGSPKVLPLSVELERDEVRREQRMYTDDPNRGYSVGYNAKVFQDGNKWKLRGDSLRCAANGNQATNVPGFAIQIRVANNEDPSDLLIASVRELVAWCREKAGRYLPINGHRDLKPTACPGDRAYALIQAGVFEPLAAPIVIDPPISDEEEPMKVIRHGKYGAAYKTNGLIKVWLDNGDVSARALAQCGQQAPEDVDANTCAAYGPIVGPVPDNHDAYGRVLR